MKNIFEIIKNNPLLNDIAKEDFVQMFHCVESKVVKFKKNDIILLTGDAVNYIGLILSGRVRIIKEDMDGKINLLAELSVSELFGETFACAGISHSPVTVQATENCEIFFMNYRKIINICSSVCVFHTKIIENMLKIVANKNLMLNQKIEILSKRTTREKLLLYLKTESSKKANKKIVIPYNREELAHYLCVDRSAMSNELCKMRDEGILYFNKNEFEFL